jgi:3',5'-cyclic AMP phosphodiesterase CpdA
MERSEFLGASMAGLGSLILPVSHLSSLTAKHSLRFHFVTDMHLPETPPAEVYRRFIKKLKENRVDFILNGGDSICDGLKATPGSIDGQWKSYASFLNEISLPVHGCLGNHDIEKWELTSYTGSNPTEEKSRAVKEMGMPHRYYRFKRENWHFIVLDSSTYVKGGYEARLDDEQFSWLRNELSKIPSNEHVLILSHIPLFSACYRHYLKGDPKGIFPKIESRLLHQDGYAITELFSRYANIRLCLSGHLHMQEKIEYKGLPYYCLGAVCGNMWKGEFNGFVPAFFTIELGGNGAVKLSRTDF